MSDGSSIKAGGVHFEIGANAQKLKQAVRDSDQELKNLGKNLKNRLGAGVGSGALESEIQKVSQRLSSQLGPKLGNDLAQVVVRGFLAAFGGRAVDEALRQVLAAVRDARDGGELDGFELGVRIMEGIRKGLESVPVSGPLGSLIAEALDGVFGNPLADERMREKFLAQAKKIAEAYEGIGSLTRGAERRGLDPIAKQLAEAEEALRPLISRLLELGQSSVAIDEAAEAFRRFNREAAVAAADKMFSDAIRTVDRITGAADANAEQLRQVRDLQSRVKQALQSAGLASEAEDAGDLIGRRFGEGIAESLEAQLRDIGKSELDRLFDRLRAAEVNPEFVARALEAKAAIERASIGPISPKTYDTFSTFLASRLDQQVASEPVRKLDDKVGKIQRDLERLLREIRDPTTGLSFGA